MSLLVDPDYFLHSLRLNYLRKLADPCGPHLISFTSQGSVDSSTSDGAPPIADATLANPYIQLAGLADPERWPELLVRGSPPDSVPHMDHVGRRGRRRGGDEGLKYSETIVGKGSGGAGMRVSGKRTSKGSRRTVTRTSQDDAIRGNGGVGTQPRASETALALTEGRAELGTGGLNPEDSDDEPPDPQRHQRQGTADTVRASGSQHKRNRSFVTFSSDADKADSPTQIDSPSTPSGVFNKVKRASRLNSISSSIRSGLTMTTMSEADASILRDRRPSEAPTIDSLIEEEREGEDEGEGEDDGIEDDDDGIETPQRRSSYPSAGVPASAPTGGSTGERFYADPDKRLSDMLFRAGAGPGSIPPHRRGQMVGSVQLEPAPLEELEHGVTEDTEAEASSALEDGEEEEGTDGFSFPTGRRRQRQIRRPRAGTDDSGVSSSEVGYAGTDSSIGKSLSNTYGGQSLSDLAAIPEGEAAPSPVPRPAESPQPPATREDSPPPMRRRERRRVNIKLGNILGSLAPAVTETNSAATDPTPLEPHIEAPQPVPSMPPKLSISPEANALPAPVSPSHRVSLPDSPRRSGSKPATPRSSLPDLRGAVLGSTGGRARSRTTPTPLREEVAVDTSSEQPKRPALSPTKVQSDSAPKPAGSSTSVATSAGGSKPRRERAPQITFAKREVVPQTQKSGLTKLLTAQKSSPELENPFRTFYASLAVRDRNDRNALKITVWFPFAKDPDKPLKMVMRSDVCIEEVVGFALWTYIEEGKEPKLDDVGVEGVAEGDTAPWNLRLVEDDGEVDEDFPALERTRPAAKVGSTEFAVVVAPPDQAQQNAIAQKQIQRRPSRILTAPSDAQAAPLPTLSPQPAAGGSTLAVPNIMPHMSSSLVVPSSSLVGLPSSASASAIAPGPAVYLRIRIPSPHKGVEAITTTLNVPTDMYLADVLEHVCKKKDLGPAREWALVVPSPSGGKADEVVVPLDRTVEGLQGVNLLALTQRSKVASALRPTTRGVTNTNPSASIFKRISEPPQPRYVTAADLTTTFKSYAVQTKRRGILGKHERTLSIDGDYVHIGPGSIASASGGGKTSSYHASQIEDVTRRGQHGVRLAVWRGSEKKRYEVEVDDAKVAAEIISHIKAMIEASRATR